MKISVIGAGNVGGSTAMRLLECGLGDIVLVDITKGLALGKSSDMEDAGSALRNNYRIKASEDLASVKDSNIVVMTAGFARKPGMSREDLLNKNAQIIKDVCLTIKNLASTSILIVVTNPLDLMTYLALKVTGFKRERVFGMGASLDAARFSNQISRQLNIPNADIEACVIGSHGEGMLPLPRLTTIKGIKLTEMLEEEKVELLVKNTLLRGQEIVSLLGSGSAYFAPSQAITNIVRAVIKDEKRLIGVSSYLSGEYKTRDICIGVPCRLGKEGIESIVELDLNKDELASFHESAESIRKNIKMIEPFYHGL